MCIKSEMVFDDKGSPRILTMRDISLLPLDSCSVFFSYWALFFWFEKEGEETKMAIIEINHMHYIEPKVFELRRVGF